MFHSISPEIQAQMGRLEGLDAQDRIAGTPHRERLRQIPAETGRFLAILAANSPPGNFIEIGTSAGYSTLWLSLACRESGRTITTFEVMDNKVNLATGTFRAAEVEDVVELIFGDAREHLTLYQQIPFCFLDAEKEFYSDCYDLVVPNLASGGLLVADNVISHQEALQPFVDRALGDERIDAVVVPVGKGLLVCRRI